jgi:predicted MPP superfamily phosphohydrolase
MDNVQILIIDDQTGQAKKKDDRTRSYLVLEKHEINNRPIKLDFSTSLEDAASKIANGRYQLALIDVVLDGWGDRNGEGFKSLIIEASKMMPVGIVSSQWDISSMSYVRQIFQNDSAEIDVRLLFRWWELKDPEILKLVILQLHNEMKRYHKFAEFNRPSCESLRLLHLSDLHIGSDKSTLAGSKLQRVVDTIHRKWDDGPDFIVVTGDIANTGHPEEYARATEWFKELVELFGWSLPSRRLLLVPGNHDFNLPLAAGSEIVIDNEKRLHFPETIDPEKMRSAVFAMTPFQAFAAETTGQINNWQRIPFCHWVETGYIHHGIIFSGFNTSSMVQKNAWPQRIIIEDSIRDVENIIKSYSTTGKPLLHISLSHHGPVKATAEEPIDNHSYYKTHLLDTESKPHLIFHGHEHMRETHLFDGETLVVTAPTPTSRGGRKPDNARGFSLIELTRNSFLVDGANIFPYIFDGTRWHGLDDIKHYQFKDNVFTKKRVHSNIKKK